MRQGVVGLAALLASVLSVPATAITLEQRSAAGQSILWVTGEFLQQDGPKFRRAVQQAGRIDEVWFSSPGGNVMAALEIGRFLRKSGLATRVPKGASCASACTYAFIGGVFRAVDPTAKVGVHNSTVSGNDELIAKVTRMIRENGVAGAYAVVNIVERAAASIAAEQSRYLMEMTVSSELMRPITDTFSVDMHWLTPTELRRYNVVNE
ncbi:hypothetical protein D3877_29035 [Azospirillum cavernae]|uniref:Periplasmic protein-like protein n=1 Tax=Azospirillum cavernae TaxID=2320860 RepID=A0A418VJW6_9PROT|nr:hypothetical protein [Azospirillum cavernae]RJF76432.1 hypothetical protein D3877_29035 [Azospirillum cavernae]